MSILLSSTTLQNSYSLLARSYWKNFIRARWKVYALGVISVLITNVMQVFAPKLIGWTIDFFGNRPIPLWFTNHSSNPIETFHRLFFALVLSRVIINFTRFLWRITLGRQTHYAASIMRTEVWDYVRFFRREDFHSRYTKGQLMSASISDTNSAKFIFGFTIVAISDVFFLGIFTVLAMAFISLPLTLTALFILTFVPIGARKISEKEIVQYKLIQNFLSEFNDYVSQAVQTLKMQRLTQTGSLWEKKLREKAESYRSERLKGQELNLKYVPFMGIATILSYLILFSFGIYGVFQGNLTPGQFIALQGLIFLLHDPLMSLGFIISEWKKGNTALHRLMEIFHHPPDPMFQLEGKLKNSLYPSMDEDQIVYDVKNLNIKFATRPELEFPVIHFQMRNRERLGIMGPIGAGKTSLMNILSGIENNFVGEVLYCQKPIASFSPDILRSEISIVPQRPFLFADNIRENLCLGNNISDEELYAYLEIAGMKEDVLKFPQKLLTPLGEWGINLSGGQKQRLTLARALIRRPKILLLDDCLSAIDTVTEEKILTNLENQFKDISVVWVAHRKSTLRNCHRIIELENSYVKN